jgi:deoxyadenosine/deoxycytidine kinase
MQIRKGGREYEQNIEVEYLERLNRRYNDWIENNYRGEIFVIDKDNNDFLENAKVLEALYERLDQIRESKK